MEYTIKDLPENLGHLTELATFHGTTILTSVDMLRKLGYTVHENIDSNTHYQAELLITSPQDILRGAYIYDWKIPEKPSTDSLIHFHIASRVEATAHILKNLLVSQIAGYNLEHK